MGDSVGTFYCAVCERTLYAAEGETSFCPVCSSPLVQVQPEADETLVIDQQDEAAAS